MTEHELNTGPSYQLEGPSFQEGQWIASIKLGPKQKTFYGKTQKEVQKAILSYIDQQIFELRKASNSLHESLYGKQATEP